MARPELDSLIAAGEVTEDAALAAVVMTASGGEAVRSVIVRQSSEPTVRTSRGRYGKVTERRAGSRQQLAALGGVALDAPVVDTLLGDM